MRHISFALTTPQIRARTKTVTRRLGWLDLKPGAQLQAVVKAQGIPKGGHVERLAVIRVRDVRREVLAADLTRYNGRSAYAVDEMTREGFPGRHPVEFVQWFCVTHRCSPDQVVTRIAFEYVDPVDDRPIIDLGVTRTTVDVLDCPPLTPQ